MICVFHDVEEDVDTAVAPAACRDALVRMLAIERARGARVTYSVLGRLFATKADAIRASGEHALAFHSYDHRVDDRTQLARVREVDLQVKGYRPPRSVITDELADYALAYWNFEWLLSSAASFGFAAPRLENGIVKIPVHLDDYPLHTRELSLEAWLDRLDAEIRARDFVAVGLHDCYAPRVARRVRRAPRASRRAPASCGPCDQVVDRLLFASALRPLIASSDVAAGGAAGRGTCR